MTDILVRAIPLPIPRPVMEEVHLGSDKPGIDWNIPMPDMANLDLSFPLVGSNWWLHQWSRFKDMFNLYEGKHSWYEFQLNSYEEYILVFGVLLAIGILAGGLELLLKKIWIWK